MRATSVAAALCLAMTALSCTRHAEVADQPSPASTSVGHADDTTAAFTPTSAELESRDRPATEDDLRLLLRADAILAEESAWNRDDDRACDDDDAAGCWSLFCALHKACIEVLGEYDHRRVALQEVRFAIQDATPGRTYAHRLRDFNNHPETRFEDVKRVLRVAVERVRARSVDGDR